MLMEEFFNSQKKDICETSLFIRAFAYQTYKDELPGTVAFHDGSCKQEDVIYYRASKRRRFKIAIPHELRETLRKASREGEPDGLCGVVPVMTMRKNASYYRYPVLNYDRGKMYMVSLHWTLHESQEGLLQQNSLEKCQNDFGHNPCVLRWEDPTL